MMDWGKLGRQYDRVLRVVVAISLLLLVVGIATGAFGQDSSTGSSIELSPDNDSFHSTRLAGTPDTVHHSDTVGRLTTIDVSADRTVDATAPVVPDLPVAPDASPWRRFCDGMPQGRLAVAAIFIPGFGQIVNRDYWKLPVFYGGMAGFTALGLHFNHKWQDLNSQVAPTDPGALADYQSDLKNYRWRTRFSYIAAGLTYSLSVFDALYFHERRYISPVTAMVASALLPGLGQVYTQRYWKVPMMYGLGIYFASNMVRFNQLTHRYDRALTALLDQDPTTVDEFNGKRNQSDLEHMRDYNQRWRDFNTIMLSLLYVLNVLDAYVSAHLFYWNVDDNLSLMWQPSIAPLQVGESPQAMALQVQLRF
ncbi:MAG: hypothetical protein CSA97_05950 [Bacteroidetes bacterium]|nr:MAG: hypothetical protein CSA97_05950 [Bacteroidota bacterium]